MKRRYVLACCGPPKILVARQRCHHEIYEGVGARLIVKIDMVQ
jgi:hypothetical protein